MEPAFWNERWQSRRIGFHQSHINPLLQQYWPDLAVKGGTVFVPLCGMSTDMHYLAQQGHKVLGVELVERAVAEFFQTLSLSPSVEPVSAHEHTLKRYQHSPYELFAGDFFALDPALTGEIDGVFDRAALIALPPELRLRYAQHMCALIKPGTPILLITLEYPEGTRDGPPFSIDAAEVARLYAAQCSITQLARVPLEEKGQQCWDSTYLLRRLP